MKAILVNSCSRCGYILSGKCNLSNRVITDMSKLIPDWCKLPDFEISPDYLVDFMLYLNDKGLIDNHSFEYEKEAKKYLKNVSKNTNT